MAGGETPLTVVWTLAPFVLSDEQSVLNKPHAGVNTTAYVCITIFHKIDSWVLVMLSYFQSVIWFICTIAAQ